jgi:hypothetical protein
MNEYTSLELSKKLWDNGCRVADTGYNHFDEKGNDYTSYDILWDICVKYSKEFFGNEILSEDFIMSGIKTKMFTTSYKNHSKNILSMLQNNKSQDEIEIYIWDNCSFNPKNKE